MYFQGYDLNPQAPKREIHDKIEGLLDEAQFIYKVCCPYFLYWHLLTNAKDWAAKTGIFCAVKSWSLEGRNGATVYARGQKRG